MARRLLGWYDRNRRDLPWRAPPGIASDPYRVWLSEIMLQQTTVAAVGPYFRKFIARWPTVAALAAAPLDDLLAAWAGLGYYARARNLRRAAQIIVADHGGRLPGGEAELRRLPGVGGYSAAAIAAIAFDHPAAVVDGNIERVLARAFSVLRPLPAAKAEIRALAALLTPKSRAGDYAQAVMDLGATLCTTAAPKCLACPWREFCAAHAGGIAESLPRRAPRKAKPSRHGIVFWIERGDGAVLLRRRAEHGLLGAMTEIPSTEWRDQTWSLPAAKRLSPIKVERWQKLPGVVRHGFTHFDLTLTVIAGRARDPAPPLAPDTFWCPVAELGRRALPTVMRKLARHAAALFTRAGS